MNSLSSIYSEQYIFPYLSSRLGMNIDDEQQLVEDAKTSTEAFGKLYDRYFPKVYAFVASKVNNRHDAEDLAGDIFIKVVENIGNFEWKGVPFAAWIFKIARNTLNDYYYKTSRTKVSNIDEAFEVKEDEEKTSPHKKAAQEELSVTVKKVMSQLPERELEVLQLKFFSQLTNREIVQVTGLSESNVAVILYRTLRKIKTDLKYFA